MLLNAKTLNVWSIYTKLLNAKKDKRMTHLYVVIKCKHVKRMTSFCKVIK